MKRLQVHGLWLVLQIISTSQERATHSNMNSVNGVTSGLILLPTPSVSNDLGKQTLLVHKSSRNVIESRYTNISNVQSRKISKYGTFTSVFTPGRTRTQSVRNFYNNTQSVRDIFKNTQTWSVDLQTISSTEYMLMRENTTYVGTKTYNVYSSTSPSTIEPQQSTMKVMGSSNIVQNTTGVPHRYSSANILKTHARISSTIHTPNTAVPQSSVPVTQSSNVASYSTIDESQVGFTVSSSRSYPRRESSSNYRFLSSKSTTQTPQLSRIINVSLSAPSVSVTEILKTRFSVTSSYANKNHSSYAHQSSTFKDFKISKTLATAYITSTYRSSQFSRHGSNSYLTNTVYLSSTRTANNDSRIKPTTVVTAFQSISQTSANKGSVNTQTSSRETILETLRLSTTTGFRTDTVSATSSSRATELSSFISSSILATKASAYHSRIKTNEVTDHKSQEISSVILSTTTIRPHYNQPSGRGPSMPLYVLAICLPLAALLGFILAFIYFKRNKEDQRVRYSVTVEISAEKPDYELKRMYSIIDMSSGINKDFLSGLESKKASSEILDQLDSVSVSITHPDQTV